MNYMSKAYIGTFSPYRLNRELALQIPALVVGIEYLHQLSITANGVQVNYPDTVPESAIDAVVLAHDPLTPDAVELEEQQALDQKDESQTLLDSLYTPGLLSLSASARVNVVWGRRLAQIRGDVVTINSSADLVAYWNAEWVAAASADVTAGNDNQKGLFIRANIQAVLELVAHTLI